MLVLNPGSLPSGLVVPQMLQWPGLAVLSQAEQLSGGLLGSGFASGCFHFSFLRVVFPPLSLMGVALQEQILINLHHGCSGSTFCSLHLSITFRLLWFIFNQTISLLGATEACLTRLSCHCEVLQTEFKPFCCNMYQSLSSSCVYTASSKMGP